MLGRNQPTVQELEDRMKDGRCAFCGEFLDDIDLSQIIDLDQNFWCGVCCEGRIALYGERETSAISNALERFIIASERRIVLPEHGRLIKTSDDKHYYFEVDVPQQIEVLNQVLSIDRGRPDLIRRPKSPKTIDPTHPI